MEQWTDELMSARDPLTRQRRSEDLQQAPVTPTASKYSDYIENMNGQPFNSSDQLSDDTSLDVDETCVCSCVVVL